ncbi:hypothetical protein BH11MYX3_BH11MYX3_48490 [soil metagenome]
MSELPSFAAAWLRQRDTGGDRISRLELEALAALDDATALAASEALLDATPRGTDPVRATSSGFV